MAVNALTEYLAARFPEEDAEGFYSDLFMLGDIASAEDRRQRRKGTYTPILVRIMDDGCGGERVERQPVSRGLEEIAVVNALSVMDKADIISPVSYVGRRPLMDAAHELYALVFDLDNVRRGEDGSPDGLRDLLYQMEPADGFGPLLPRPTYIVSSGTGLHLYYLLDRPIRLWPNALEALDAFRAAFTARLWNRYVTSSYLEPQVEAVTQGFRMVGSRAKDGEQVVRAFWTGFRVTMEGMNAFVPDGARVPPEVLHSQHTAEEARRLWPGWDPQWRAKASAAPKRPWRVKRALFDWWCRRVEAGEASVGHRYWCVWTAAALAAKCPEVTYEELESWALRVTPMLDHLTEGPTNHFTAEDAMAAIQAYGNPRSLTLRRDKIAEKTAVEMPVNKRNGLEQPVHLYLARRRKGDMKMLGMPMKNPEGRPKGSGTKRDAIRGYAEEHPDANHSQIAKALGVSRTTVVKWLKDA